MEDESAVVQPLGVAPSVSQAAGPVATPQSDAAPMSQAVPPAAATQTGSAACLGDAITAPDRLVEIKAEEDELLSLSSESSSETSSIDIPDSSPELESGMDAEHEETPSTALARATSPAVQSMGGAAKSTTLSRRDGAPHNTAHHQTVATKAAINLDAKGNPEHKVFRTELDQFLLAMTIWRDVDWRQDPRPCPNKQKYRAAFTQQVGRVVPSDRTCSGCRAGNGPFKSCCVVAPAGTPLFRGACANCAFLQTGTSCSLRSGPNPLASFPNDALPKRAPRRATPFEARETQTRPKKARRNESQIIKSTPAARMSIRSRTAKKPQTRLRIFKAPVNHRESNQQSNPNKDTKSTSRFFKNAWLTSPLGDPAVWAKDGDFSATREALRSIPAMMESLSRDQTVLEKYLEDHDQLTTPPPPNIEEDDTENPFLAYL
ncbi:Uncharacterized protein PECH_001872 [Penicillium ucsense]|uniref:Uncharacterized protein n=1 Tax=Penicillium ucsense TaxID=2839758 RepID=A0A8J8VX90_9EURO|nr:Uncharacterized protein PECM_001619 [Penicillium ucsense]KAF7732205.1 Uncharacterized protein PECH_001872 [Penicillium ucsense]